MLEPRRRAALRASDLTAQVHDALAHLFDLSHLHAHPLARPSIAAPSGGRSVRPARAGRTLQQRLLDAMDGLRPRPGTRTDSPLWRRYLILRRRYLDGDHPAAIQKQLAIGRSLYFAEHARAVQAVADALADPGTPRGSGRVAEEGKLPARPTSFVGRVREVEEIKQLLGGEQSGGQSGDWTRLLTLTGPPGTGKTRLALAVASVVRAEGTGVWFVELGPLRDAALVLPTIAQTFAVREISGQTLLDSLIARLEDRPIVLFLDNFEHVLQAANNVAELLARCPQMRMVVTSRAPLRIYGEREFHVPPLRLPPPGAARSASNVDSEAVRLFIERARAVSPDFALTGQNASLIATACARLDGLPLAIELAAARVRLFPLPALLSHLDSRLQLLTDGPRDLPIRQRTLRGAIDWSYDLLDAVERALFRSLAVFAGECGVEAIAAVCRGSSPEAFGDSATLLQHLGTLVNHSLVIRASSTDHDLRFSMLETIREYAQQRLVEHGEAFELRRRHAEYHVRLVERAEAALAGPDQVAWLARVETEYDNVRASVAWFIERGEAKGGLRLVAALRQFWLVHGHWNEGRQWLDELLALECPDTALRAKALDRAGFLASQQGDYPAAEQFYEQSLALWRLLGDAQGIVSCLTGLGNVAAAKCDDTAARKYHEETLSLRRATGDLRGTGNALGQLAQLACFRDDYDAATCLAKESLSIRRQVGDQPGIAHALNVLGEAFWGRGAHREAEALFRESMALCRDLGYKVGVAANCLNLGQLALRQRKTGSAARLFVESAGLYGELGDKKGIALCLLRFAALAAALHEPECAVRLFGAARASLATNGPRQFPHERAELDRILSETCAQLPPEVTEAEWTIGQLMTLERALGEAWALASDVGRESAPGEHAEARAVDSGMIVAPR